MCWSLHHKLTLQRFVAVLYWPNAKILQELQSLIWSRSLDDAATLGISFSLLCLWSNSVWQISAMKWTTMFVPDCNHCKSFFDNNFTNRAPGSKAKVICWQAQTALLRASQILGKSIDLAEAALEESGDYSAEDRGEAASAPGSFEARPILSYDHTGFLTQRARAESRCEKLCTQQIFPTLFTQLL